MFDILPLIIILISLTIIIVIVARKFSILSDLDVENIQTEKEARFKERIVGNRIKRNFYKHYSRVIRFFRPIIDSLGSFFVGLYKKLLEFKDSYNKEKEMKSEKTEDILDKYLTEAEDHRKNEEFEKAEKALIEAIAIDSQSIKAFKILSDVYLDKKSYREAKQTLEHVAKLLETSYDPNKVISGEGVDEVGSQLSLIYFDLSLVSSELDDKVSALKNINKALSIESNNPRYLNTKIDVSIVVKNKEEANLAYEKLKEVDPSNQKLEEIKAKIEEIVEEEPGQDPEEPKS